MAGTNFRTKIPNDYPAMIRNYTSSASIERSLAFIEQKLSAFGVTDIWKTYDKTTKRLIGLKFVLSADGLELPVLLPAKVDKCEKALITEYIQTHSREMRDTMKEKIAEQAERTAWKLAAEWLDIQLTMVKLDQKELLEVFLADVYNPTTKQTYFEALKEKKYRALLPAAETR
jgi:hypothetical protein